MQRVVKFRLNIYIYIYIVPSLVKDINFTSFFTIWYSREFGNFTLVNPYSFFDKWFAHPLGLWYWKLSVQSLTRRLKFQWFIFTIKPYESSSYWVTVYRVSEYEDIVEQFCLFCLRRLPTAGLISNVNPNVHLDDKSRALFLYKLFLSSPFSALL